MINLSEEVLDKALYDAVRDKLQLSAIEQLLSESPQDASTKSRQRAN
jgi:hypothetical protein